MRLPAILTTYNLTANSKTTARKKVLHPDGLREGDRDRLFCGLPLLHEILRATPWVEVVFSTSWRLLYPRQALVQMVTKDAPELAPRFIGHIPALDSRERPQGIIGQREDEIRHWLSLNRQESRPWLALDDCQDSLYLVDWETGLVPDDVWAVVESLRG